jgi:outer membrane protein assembly factor BamB
MGGKNALALAVMLAAAGPTHAADWPQLQMNATRTGRTTDSVAPPYRARWIWCGPTQTLRNMNSVAGWPDDLTTRSGYSYPIPSSVSFTIAETVQPVLSSNRLFIGTMDGNAYAIDDFGGSNLWNASISGGTVASAAVAGSIVLFCSVPGTVYGLRTSDGSQAWTFSCKKALTAAPCVNGTTAYVADHGGNVYAINTSNGSQIWTHRVAAPVLGSIAVDATSVYVPAENMFVYALNTSDGAIRASHRVIGQSFRYEWPVVFSNFVWVTSCGTPIIGSEYIMESMMADSTDLANEESNIARWLTGDSNGGRWTDAGSDWRHVFALRTSDLTEPFTILAGPADGVGLPTCPVVVDNQNRVLTYFKTRYPTFTKLGGTFGTAYSIDLCAVNMSNGYRVGIGNGSLSNPWPWETDNLYGLSIAGNLLWCRQNFRGTKQFDVVNSTHRGVTAEIRNRDGGVFNFDVVYKDTGNPTGTSQDGMQARIAPIVVGSRVYYTESWSLVALEHF